MSLSNLSVQILLNAIPLLYPFYPPNPQADEYYKGLTVFVRSRRQHPTHKEYIIDMEGPNEYLITDYFGNERNFNLMELIEWIKTLNIVIIESGQMAAESLIFDTGNEQVELEYFII